MTLILSPPSRGKIGASGPPRTRMRRERGPNKPQKYLYICGENQEKIDEIDHFVTSLIPDIRERVQMLTYTDVAEFHTHSQRTLITNVQSVVAMCLKLSNKTVDEYFEVMCTLGAQLLPKFEKDVWPIDLRIALCNLYTFGKKDESFTLSEKNDTAWGHFLDIRHSHAESAGDIRERFLKPLIDMDKREDKSFFAIMLKMKLGL